MARKQSDPLPTAPIISRMVEADIIIHVPEPPSLHTEAAFETCWRPDPAKGGTEEHWHFFQAMLVSALRSFGFPAALYDKWLILNSERRAAFNMLRVLEAMLRRLLLMMAALDDRPLLPFMPRKVRSAPKAPPPAGKARKVFRGVPPEKLPIRFVLIPPAPGERKPTPKRAPAPLTGVMLILAEQRAERMKDRAWRDFLKDDGSHKRGSAFSVAARLEAVIRVFRDPLPYVMRVRQRLAAEQGRLADFICTQMLIPTVRLATHLAGACEDLYEDACAAVARLRGCDPPIVGA